MGTSASTQVHAIQQAERTKGTNVRADDAGEHTSCSDKQNEGTHSIKSFAENLQLADALNNIQRLEKLLAESESRQLDLEDRVESLQESIVELTDAAGTETISQGSMQAKDERIAQLQQECQDLQKQLSQLKVKHKRRIKKLTARVTEAKQETSIQHLELRSERERLWEDNLQLQQKLNTFDNEGTTPTEGHQRMDLVIDLSGQVSEQSEQISRLEKVIKEKDKIIQRLEQTRSLHSAADNQTSGKDSFTSLTSDSDGCHVNRLAKTSDKPQLYCTEADFFPGPFLGEYEGRWQRGISDRSNQSEVNGKKSGESEGGWQCYNGGSGKQSEDKGQKFEVPNSQFNTVTHHNVKERKAYLGDSCASLFLSDSDSDIGFDCEWSESKIRSAPPMYNGTQHKRVQAQSNKTKVRKSKGKPTTVSPIKAFEEDSFSDTVNTELGTVIRTNLEPIAS